MWVEKQAFPYLCADYGVFVRHSLEKYSVGGPDYVLIRDLNENAIRVIGSILGQSVALDHYTVEVRGSTALHCLQAVMRRSLKDSGKS